MNLMNLLNKKGCFALARTQETVTLSEIQRPDYLRKHRFDQI